MTDRRHSFMLTNIANDVTVRWISVFYCSCCTTNIADGVTSVVIGVAIGVVCCRDFVVCGIIATWTCHVGIPTNFSTGWSLSNVSNFVMAKSIDIGINITIATINTCVSCKSLLGASWISYNMCVTMVCGRDDFCSAFSTLANLYFQSSFSTIRLINHCPLTKWACMFWFIACCEHKKACDQNRQ